MPRSPRYEVANGVHHVMNRGVERSRIVRDDHDRREWLRLFDRVARRCCWRVFAWALLDNHFHIFVRTPQPNLSAGMHDFESGYASLFNRRHARSGVLFEGRFRSVAVENDSYSWELSRYVHLNSVRAGKVHDPADDPWCSYCFYLNPRGAPDWLDWGTVLGEFGGTEAAARIAYRRFVVAGVTNPPPDPLENAIDGWVLGSPEFVERCRRHVTVIERAPTLEEIATVVQDVFDVGERELRKSGHHRNAARDAAILLARELSPENLDVVAGRFGARTRSTITAAARRAAQRAADDGQLGELISNARQRLRRITEGSGV